MLIFAFWTLLALLSAAKGLLTPGDGVEDPVPARALYAFGKFYLWALFTPGIFWLSRRYPVARGSRAPRLLLHTGIAVVVAGLAKAWGEFLQSVLLSPSPKFAGEAGVWGALLRLHFLDELIIYVAVLAAGFAWDSSHRLQARRAEEARLRSRLAEARLEALRMQVNPHFLFNALNGISALVESDPDGVRRMIARLAELLRYTLEESSEQEVHLEQELEFLDGYIEIMQLRFGGRLEVRREIDPAVRGALVPNLILQPLVENAIEHGVAKSRAPGRIEIRAERCGERLRLAVRDNGAAEGPGHPDRIGLGNTRARLEQLYGDAATLDAHPVAGGGWTAAVMLPFRTAADPRLVAVSPAT